MQFVAEKNIQGEGAFVAENRVKALVAASAVQLTLGLDTWQLSYFDEIILHPADFDSEQHALRFKGETNLQGYIRLSWRSFIKGYQVQDDNLNLGLHEFSHALILNGVRGNGQDYFVEHYFNKWLSCAAEAFEDTQKGTSSIFRAYGGTNINEFLSVCIEHYFESPEEIKERYPLLYYATGILLNQQIDKTEVNLHVRSVFFLEQNKLLPGMEKTELRSDFLKHWSFKLCGFVFVMCLYNSATQGFYSFINAALLFLLAAVLLWYQYSAVQLLFVGTQLKVIKGKFPFMGRKKIDLPLTQVIRVKENEGEWSIKYYNIHDTFFHEEKIYPPKGVIKPFTESCKQNKIALI
jgi:hypothetical protein